MTTSNRFLRIALLVALSIMMVSGVTALGSVEVSLDDPVDDKVIWLNSDSIAERTVSADLRCTGDYNNGRMKILKDGNNITNVNGTSISFEFPRDSPTGEYKVKGFCDDSDDETQTRSISFSVVKASFDFVSPTYSTPAYRRHFMGDEAKGDLYKGQPMRIIMDLKGGSQVLLEKKDFTFSPKITGYSNPSGGLDYTYELRELKDTDAKNDYEILVHPFLPHDISGGYHGINTGLTYSSDTGTFNRILSSGDRALYLTGVRVQKDGIKPKKDVLLEDLIEGRLRLDLYVEPYYRKYGVSVNDFKFAIDRPNEPVNCPEDCYQGDHYFSLVSLDQAGEKYLRIDGIPKEELPEQTDKFEIDILFKDVAKESATQYIEIASYDVQTKVAFEGKVKNERGEPVSTSFKAFDSDNDFLKRFSTRQDGSYYEKFEMGNWSMNIDFTEKGGKLASLFLKNVRMQPEYHSKVRFAYKDDPTSMDIQGIDPINAMAVQFARPFQESGSKATMAYDTSGIDPTSISVFKCRKYVFSDQTCRSEEGWQKIPENQLSPQPGQPWYVEFPIDLLSTRYHQTEKKILMSAYVVGTRASLELEGVLNLLGTSNGRIPVGDQLSVEGKVVSSSGGAVEDANVTVKMLDENDEVVETFSDTSSSDGSFSASTEIEDPGNYTLEVEILRSPYKSLSVSGQEVWAYRSEGIDLDRQGDIGDQVDITIGETSKLQLTLQNTGQTTVENIELSASGLDPDYFNFSRAEISSLEGGEEQILHINFNIPEDANFSDSFPTITVEATGDGEKGTASATLEIPGVIRNTDSTPESPGTGSEDQNTGGTDTQESEQNNESSDNPLSSVTDPTAEFLASQSTLNIALGLIMVFLMALAGALKKKKGDQATGRQVRRDVVGQQGQGAQASQQVRSGARPPKVSPAGDQQKPQPDQEQQEEEPEEGEGGDHVDRMAEKMEGEGEAEEPEGQKGDSGESGVKCDICAESFDTEAAVKMHKKTAH